MSDHLRRHLAPVTAAAWEQIDREAARALRHFLAARALVDVAGPAGWEMSSVGLGRLRSSSPSPAEGVVADVRVSQPLVEMRTPFELSLLEMDMIDRGARDPDLTPVSDAAALAARAEDRAVFHGYDPGGIAGIAPSSPHHPLEIGDDYNGYPKVVARAVAQLRQAGIGGPYGIALGPRCYTGVIETTEHGGYPVLEHVKMILGGPVVWAPNVDGAIVLSVRGGDYEIVCAEDFSVGYRAHADDTVELFLEESFTLVVNEPRAAIWLRYPG